MNSLQLIEVNKAIDVCLKKIGQKPRALRNYKRLLRQGERKLLPLIKEWMNESIKEMQAGLPKMRGRTAAQRTKSIADWDEIKANGIIILKPTMFELLGEGGKMVVERKIVKQERFDVIGLEAIAWATEHTATLVTEITEETMKAIRAYITQGINAGKSVEKIARELRPLVGLTEKQIFAVANYHEMLILERPEWTAARQRQSAEVYARRLHRKRATMIARTESAFALSEGQRQGYSQMGVTHLERVEDPATEDDDCADNNGRIYSLAEAQGVLPAHPNSYSDDTEIYTENKGWQLIKQMKKGDAVLTINPRDMNLEVTKVIGLVKHYQEKMIHFSSHDFDLLVTPEHNMLAKLRKRAVPNDEKWEFIPAVDMTIDTRIFRSSLWKGDGREGFYYDGFSMDNFIFAEFMGYWLSEGSLRKDNKTIIINQDRKTNKRNYEEIQSLLSLISNKVYEWKTGLAIINPNLHCYLSQFGYSYQRYIPQDILKLNPDCIKSFLNAYALGDGHIRNHRFKDGNFRSEIIYTTSSREIADGLGECLIKVGRRPSFYLAKRKGKKINHKNGIYVGNHDIWYIRECYSTHGRIGRIKKDWVDYNKLVYCIEVSKNNTLFIRRNGKVAWCGNCEGTWVAA